MQYLVTVYDYKNSLDKRLSVRPEHVKLTKELLKSGDLICASAILENDKMIGSIVVTNFSTQEEFDRWLKNEIYVVNGVWDMESMKILPIRVLTQDS